jgi:hypothetical protein
MADFIKLRTHITSHERLLSAGPHARDLYVWGMLHAGQQETDGHLPMIAVLSSPWGYGGRANIKAAARLVEVGLWERTDGGYVVSRWAEQGNMTKATLEEKRKVERERKSKQRNSSFPVCPTGTPDGTPSGTPASAGSSTSTSPSGSGSLGEMQGGVPPDWFGAALETVSVQTGETIRPADAWLRYFGHRRGKGISPTQQDAVYWLTTVMVPEARKERRADADKRERDAKFDRARSGGPAEPGKLTDAEQRTFAAQLRERLAKQRGAA